MKKKKDPGELSRQTSLIKPATGTGSRVSCGGRTFPAGAWLLPTCTGGLARTGWKNCQDEIRLDAAGIWNFLEPVQGPFFPSILLRRGRPSWRPHFLLSWSYALDSSTACFL